MSQLPAYALSSVQTAATAVFTNNLPPEAMKDLAAKISPRAAFFIYGEHGQGGTEETPNRGFYAAAESRRSSGRFRGRSTSAASPRNLPSTSAA